jgi:UDP-N-acetylmuramate dehydrogenase
MRFALRIPHMRMNVEHNFDLSAHNTFGVRTQAETYIRVTDEATLPDAIALARKHAGDRGIFVLGGGSNLLFTRDYAGCILHIATQGLRVLNDNVVEACAGDAWHKFVLWSLIQGLAGVENLSLIPGSVGASPIQNIGAYGVELKDVFHSCDAISLSTGETRRFNIADCAFGYRDSYFKSFAGRDWVIKRVRFALSSTPNLKLDYGELRSEILRKGISAPTALDVSTCVIDIRTRKLPDPVLLGNAGSFFKNPVIPSEQFHALFSQIDHVPHFPDRDGWIKVPAGWLIDRCGFKGVRRGAAGVHAQHALVLVNHGGATGGEIWALANEVMAAVEQRFCIQLEPEPIVL